jgi:hypothetical protein
LSPHASTAYCWSIADASLMMFSPHHGTALQTKKKSKRNTPHAGAGGVLVLYGLRPPQKGLAGVMSDNDQDFGSQEPSNEASTPREKLLSEWEHTLYDPPSEQVYNDWTATHYGGPATIQDEQEQGTDFTTLDPLPGAVLPTYPAFVKFNEVAERFRVRLKALDAMAKRARGQHIGSTLDEIETTEARDVLAGVIPCGQITVAYGLPKVGKSALAHKYAIVVSSDDLDLDGEPVTHGRVLFVTLDPGARKEQVKPRMMRVAERLGVKRRDDRLIVVDDIVFLDDPLSVESLLQHNPGAFELVVIDPLYKALSNGDPSVASVMVAATEGMKMICERTGAALLLLHHATKVGGEMYGSVFLKAALDAQLFVERVKDMVKVTVEEVKNGAPREKPFVYRLDGAFLESTDRAAKGNGKSDVSAFPHANMLALIPTTDTLKREARKLVAHLLTGTNTTQEKQWQRWRKDWLKAGATVENGDTIRRVVGEDVS